MFSAQIPYKNALCKRQSLQSIITFKFTSILWRNWPQAPSSSNQSYQLHWFHLLPPMDCLKYTQYLWSVCTCVSRFQFHILRWKCYLNISCLAMIADHLPGLEKRTSNDQCTKWKSSFLIPAMDFSVDLGKKNCVSDHTCQVWYFIIWCMLKYLSPLCVDCMLTILNISHY